MSIKYGKWPYRHKIYQHLPLQAPPKFTQIWIFGLKIYHLATLILLRNFLPATSNKCSKNDRARSRFYDITLKKK
jgi:hypothetical protein